MRSTISPSSLTQRRFPISTANPASVMPMTNRSHGERGIGSRVGRSPAARGPEPAGTGSVAVLMAGP
ncbi:hypothetical protein [Pseudonocardia humida]|uniref:Uncharacterized protein n=1 Tax=Pseudonocardia humida TaxID=2800819 RepID=A0ABT1A4M7_9PSEU|nr:hypothetical protein [Pseudonocardia humida]MCO1657903.1 hypothetical protein [Pseudonocardia humida]